MTAGLQTTKVLSAILASALLLAACASSDNGETAAVDTGAATEDADAAADDAGADDGASANAEPIRIGFLSALSGPNAAPGNEMLRGAQLAVDQWGSIDGRPIELIPADTTFDPELAVAEAQSLVTDDAVHALLGIYASSEMLAINGISERLGVPIVTTNTGATEITGEQCSPWAFRVNPSDAMSANATALAFESRPEFTEFDWYAVGSDYAWGHSQVSALKEIDGVNLVGEEYVPTDVTDFGNIITNIEAAGPDAIWGAVLTGTPLLQFLVQARDFGVKDDTTIVAPVGLPEVIMKEDRDASLGVLSTGRWGGWTFEDQNDHLAEVNQAWYDAYDETPPFQGLNAYLGAEVLFQAIERAESTEPEDIVAALEAGEPFETIYGDLIMGADDHQLRTPVFFGRNEELPEPKYGAEIAFKVEEVFDGADVLPPVTCELG